MPGLPITIKTNVEYTQAGGCYLCLHVGSVAVFFGRRDKPGRRLELLTPPHGFRYSNLASKRNRKRTLES